ncbi:hypothetical protein IQ31_04465 [Sphingobacterium siyangense]|uniref:Uncharacterized protein n=1 Tax=Sphingobacterium siyangense TaxID=459529 RepID=A0A562M8U7_9SPHI|nr:hypothetical protein IQ31_04465 [Sphingobacterium siyangense]
MENNLFKLLISEIGHGVIKKVSTRSGVSYPTTLRCFQGKSRNIKVLEASVVVLKEHRKRVKDLRDQLLQSI